MRGSVGYFGIVGGKGAGVNPPPEGSPEVIYQVLAALLTGADLFPEAIIKVAICFCVGLLLQPDQLLPQLV